MSSGQPGWYLVGYDISSPRRLRKIHRSLKKRGLALAPQTLNAAWKSLKGDNAVWIPGLSRADMEKNIALHLIQLADELRTGAYRPHPTRMFPVAKADGGKRIISALTLRDKLAQKTVLWALRPLGESLFHSDSYGYRPGRSVEMAVSKAREHILCGLEWLVDADIRQFFDRIPHGPLRKVLKRTIDDREMLKLIDMWLDVGAPRTGFLTKRRGVPQGGVLSPFFCNLYLTGFDQRLAAANLPFVRFADDFLVFAPTQRAAEAARTFVGKELNRLDLELHPDKTRVVRSGPAVRFLGRKMPRAPKYDAPDGRG
ncbi:MAG: Retron-type reverse transcriptase [Magnetococcales bacterium]|nr:Retron-type reverse transcriptase [Magnetococcales bacterium]